MYVPTNPKIFWLFFFSQLRSSWIDQNILCLPIWCDGLATSYHRSRESDLQLDTKTLLYTKTVYDHDIFIYLKGEVRNRKEVMYIEYYHKSNDPNILLLVLPWRKLQSLVINLRPLLSSSWPPLPNSVWKTSQSRYAKIIKVLWGVLLKPHFSNWSKSLTWRIIWVAYVFIIF